MLSIRLPLEREKTIRDSITHFAMLLWRLRASLVAQLVKNLPATWEIPVRLLGQEGPLEKGMATHSSILAWRVPWTVESMGSQRVGHDSDFHYGDCKWAV